MGKILVVEDEVNIRAAKEALFMARENKIDVFILDIQLEDYSGLELAKQLREIDTYKLTPIIFISMAISKEFEAYRQIHCYSFLEKPFKEEDLKRVLEEIVNYGIKIEKKPPSLKLKYKNITYIVREAEIIFIEKKNRKLFVKTIHEDITHSSSALSRIQEQLSGNFLRCHQGFIINKTFIQKVDHKKHLVYIERIDFTIPIGRKFRKDFYESIENL